MDEGRPAKADNELQPGGAGRSPTYGAAPRSAKSRTRSCHENSRTGAGVRAATIFIHNGAPEALVGCQRGGPETLNASLLSSPRKRGSSALARARAPDRQLRRPPPWMPAFAGMTTLAVPQNRKWRRNPLIRLKTDSEMAPRAQTRETPQAAALAIRHPVADRAAARGNRRRASSAKLRLLARSPEWPRPRAGAACRSSGRRS